MKQVIGIYVGPYPYGGKWDEKNLLDGTIGGVEVWVVEIASAFARKGYHVIVFGDPKVWHFAKDGVEYVPFQLLRLRKEYQHFDYFIINRKYGDISKDVSCPKFYIMAHDCCFLNVPINRKITLPDCFKVAYQSEFQHQNLSRRYGIPNDKFFYVRNGVDQSYYIDDKIIEKKNKMVWSSQKVRGVRLIIEKMLPLIRKEIPDFEIDVCGYLDNLTDDYFKAEGVNLIGRVSKEELARRQRESKVWIYPNWGKFDTGAENDETFCLTAVENGLSKNAIVISDKGCFRTTLGGYEGFVGQNMFDGKYVLPEEKLDDYCAELAKQTIKILKDDEYREKLANNAFEICKKYTYDKAVEDWEKEFKGESKVCVVIPTHKTELNDFEKHSLLQGKKIFANRDIYLVCGDSLDAKIYGFKDDQIIRFDDDFFKSVNGYNKLCKSPEFYERFEKMGYEYMQTYQLDCWVFRDDLDKFVGLGYDYYGAPWARKDERTGEIGEIGNGGFSLRNIKNLKDLCLKFRDYTNIAEDVYFAQKNRDNIKIAPLSACVDYSFECSPDYFFKKNGNRLPMGCHQPYIYGREFYKNKIEGYVK